jgi:tetratricopeptide (TPR) repeat protein
MYQGDRVLIPESGKSLIQCAEQKYAHGTLVAYNEDGQMIWRVFQDIAIDDIAISADGKYIPYAHAARLYMLDGKGQRLWDRPVGSGFQCVTIAKDGSWVAGGGKSGNVMAFDSSGNLMWKYHTEMGVNRISISPDGQFVLAGSLDSNIYLLNKQGRLVFRSLLASTPYSLTMANDLSSISVGTQDGTLYCLKYTDHAELIKDANEALHQAGASEKAGYYDKAIEKYEKLGIVPEILRNYSNWIALMKQQGKPEEASRLKEKMRPWQKLARTRKKTPKQEEPGQPLIIGPAGDQKPVEPPSDRFRDISKVESRWKGLEKRLREYIQIDLDRRENSYKWEKRESAANPTTTSSYNIFPLARMKLVINGTDAAKALYCEGSELFLVGSQFRKDVPPGYLDDHELTFRIYLGKGMDAASNAAAVIADKILVKSRGSKGSFETHRKSELAAQDFISGNRSRAAQHCEEVFDLTKNAGVIPDRVPTSGKTGLFTFSYAFARCQIIDGLLKKEPGLVKGGLEYYSLLLKAGIASYSTSSENFAEEELIVLYDIALSLGMKIDVQTPFIPPSILENGYWYKPLS